MTANDITSAHTQRQGSMWQGTAKSCGAFRILKNVHGCCTCRHIILKYLYCKELSCIDFKLFGNNL